MMNNGNINLVVNEFKAIFEACTVQTSGSKHIRLDTEMINTGLMMNAREQNVKLEAVQ